jgi:hypothetical protein
LTDEQKKKQQQQKRKFVRFFFLVFQIDYIQSEKTRKIMIEKRDNCPEKKQRRRKTNGIIICRISILLQPALIFYIQIIVDRNH